MFDRQVMCLGTTCEGMWAEGKRPGNLPSLICLDDWLFNPFKRSCADHVAATYLLDFDDERKCSMVTPKKAWKTLARVWPIAMTSSLIITAMDRTVPNLEEIIKNGGALVEETGDGARRNGHRSVRCRMPPLDPGATAALEEMMKKFGGGS